MCMWWFFQVLNNVYKILAHYLLYRLKRQVQSGLYIAFYHLLMIPTLLCYVRCVVADAGEAVQYKLISKDDAERQVNNPNQPPIEDDREILTVDTNRYCGICQQPKPERAHHCSECNTYSKFISLFSVGVF